MSQIIRVTAMANSPTRAVTAATVKAYDALTEMIKRYGDHEQLLNAYYNSINPVV